MATSQVLKLHLQSFQKCSVKRAIRSCETTSSMDPAYLYNCRKQS
ncbi:unnamed protein product [Callosobruchus maculatus]|uniref:Uncharacterized protein n=1 Tax=Callosobruchus maculatus TaxID=64391 RepID=A0A653D661_CALMS|nr:unnamed protein product [Callosobruchus maculatus]